MVGATPPTIGLALGGGGARGFAHIVVLETLDELGLRPSIIAGTSIGAIAGALYASGLSGRALRELVVRRVAEPMAVARDLVSCRAGGLDHLFSIFGNPMLLDAQKVAAQFLPDALPAEFANLKTPLLVVATDFHGKSARVLESGALRSALAASFALPGLFQPVSLDGRMLVDGGVTNPVPFDLLTDRADIIIAVDVNGGTNDEDRPGSRGPRPLDVLFASIQIMAHAIVAEKLARFRPAIVVRPPIGRFRLLDFLKAEEILAAAGRPKTCSSGRSIRRSVADGASIV